MSNPLASWNEEQRSALLYRACAEAESGAPHAELFHRLAGQAEAQAAIWRAQLTARGYPPPGPYVPDARTRVVAALVRRFGPRRLKGMLAAMKVRGMGIYSRSPARDPGHAALVAETGVETRHRGRGKAGNLRTAVLGVNDGLVLNASLILGIAGANLDARVVLLTGIAGMCAGALARAVGDFVAVRARDGEALGLRPDEPGSPCRAAISSSVSFAAGALLPLASFTILPGPGALPVAIGVTAVELFATGALLSLFNGRGALRSGGRMLALGGLAGAVAYGIGRLAGVALG